MSKRRAGSAWAKLFQRSMARVTRLAVSSGKRTVRQALKRVSVRSKPPPGAGIWKPGVANGPGGMRRFRLYRPPAVGLAERLPLLVMLHGCGQDANAFATSTRMNRLAMDQRFLVLYPEQERLANAQGCWNWFDTASGRAAREAESIMQAINQVCLQQPVDRTRVAIAGLSAGASMAALLAIMHPGRFRALIMHSGIPPGSAHSSFSALGAMRGRHGHAALVANLPLVTSSWPPLLVIHGAADKVVALANAHGAIRLWAGNTGAPAGVTRQVRRGRRLPMAVTDYMRGGSLVATLAVIDGLGHAWSGGLSSQPFADGRGPDASRMVWSFAVRQFRH